MKAVLRSVKPYWLYLILTNKKKIEVGKNKPNLPTPFTTALYCSKDKKSFNRIPEEDMAWFKQYVGNVACEFVCDKIYKKPKNIIYLENAQKEYLDVLKDACLSEIEVIQYCGGSYNKNIFFWNIYDLKIYDKPKELGGLENMIATT